MTRCERRRVRGRAITCCLKRVPNCVMSSFMPALLVHWMIHRSLFGKFLNCTRHCHVVVMRVKNQADTMPLLCQLRLVLSRCDDGYRGVARADDHTETAACRSRYASTCTANVYLRRTCQLDVLGVRSRGAGRLGAARGKEAAVRRAPCAHGHTEHDAWSMSSYIIFGNSNGHLARE